ncbi:MAG: hypothetical protein QM661_13845 [Solimonas sp.]
MNKIHTRTRPLSRLLPAAAVAALCLGLQGCIDRDTPVSSGGSSSDDSTTCSNLPSSTTSYKGGDALGEELTVSLNPSTLAYTITVDASLQRTAATELSGTLTQVDGCTYSSSENGAVFTVGSGGVLQGGIATVSGSSFTPLLAFSSTYSNADTPTVFSDVAAIYNTIGVQNDGTSDTSYGGSGRLRSAGTFQLCIDDSADGGFITYDSSCTDTAKGYITWNSDRSAFDLYTTSSTATTGGTLTGSMVIGLVDSTYVPLQLVRESTSSVGMRLYAAQSSLTSGTADGDYVTIDSSGSNAEATWSGTSFTHGSSTATLSYDSPVAGVVAASGTLAGYLIYSSGIYGFVPSSSSSGAAFELGLID